MYRTSQYYEFRNLRVHLANFRFYLFGFCYPAIFLKVHFGKLIPLKSNDLKICSSGGELWSFKILRSKFGGLWDATKVKYFETTQSPSVSNVLMEQRIPSLEASLNAQLFDMKNL